MGRKTQYPICIPVGVTDAQYFRLLNEKNATDKTIQMIVRQAVDEYFEKRNDGS